MNQNEALTKVRELLKSFVEDWTDPVSPEPSFPTPLPDVAPLKLRRDSYREAWLSIEAEGRRARAERDGFCAVIVGAHELLDKAGVSTAHNSVCIDPDCHSMLGHRIRALVNSRDAERAIVRELSQVRGIAESTGGRTHAWVTRPYLDVTIERLAQDQQWGGAAVDDTRSFTDWIYYIRHQISSAIGHRTIIAPVRTRFVKIAALAIAAVEAIDRRADRNT